MTTAEDGERERGQQFSLVGVKLYLYSAINQGVTFIS